MTKHATAQARREAMMYWIIRAGTKGMAMKDIRGHVEGSFEQSRHAVMSLRKVNKIIAVGQSTGTRYVAAEFAVGGLASQREQEARTLRARSRRKVAKARRLRGEEAEEIELRPFIHKVVSAAECAPIGKPGPNSVWDLAGG